MGSQSILADQEKTLFVQLCVHTLYVLTDI